MKPHVRLFVDERGEGRFAVVAGNGRVVCQSEGYADLHAAEKGARALIRAVTAFAGRVDDDPTVFRRS